MSYQLAPTGSHQQSEAARRLKADPGSAWSGDEAFDRGRPDALFSPRSRATRTGLRLKDDLTFDAWSRIGMQVGTLADSSAWWIGDWLVYGQRAYPTRYRTAIAATGFSYQTLRNYAWVASQFPVYRRRDKLSFGHHAEVASLAEDDQEMWLLRASTHRWSRNELRRRLRSSNVEPPAHVSVAIAIQVEELRHERWRAAAIAHGRDLGEWITAVVDEAAHAALDAAELRLAG